MKQIFARKELTIGGNDMKTVCDRCYNRSSNKMLKNFGK